MKVRQYDTVLLKDGRIGSVVEALSDKDFLVDVGTSPNDWETVSLSADEIEKVIEA